MINDKCPLVLSDLYEYDFNMCGYRILTNLGWDMSGVDKDNKVQRNIQIGCILRDNPDLSNAFHITMQDVLNHYIQINKIEPENIILSNKDGLILNKKMKILNSTMPIDFRGLISKMIITVTRRGYLIIYINSNVIVKGLLKKPISYDVFSYFRNLNYTSKHMFAQSVELYRQKLYNGLIIKRFAIEEDDGTLSVPVKSGGFVKINKSVLHMIDSDEIDYGYIWEEFVWPYISPILIHIT